MKLTSIFHFGRSGSKVLTRLMASLSNCLCLYEISSYDEAKKQAPLGDLRLANEAHIGADVVRTAIETQARKRSNNAALPVIIEVTDWDIIYSRIDCSFDTLGKYFSDLSSEHCVFLRRRNTLKLILSHYIANNKKVWHTNKLADGPQAVEIKETWMRSQINLRLRRERAIEASLMRSGVNYIELYYEDLIEDDPVTGARWLLGKLGIPEAREPSENVPLVKTNPYPAHQLITNVDKIRSSLLQMDCEWMLY